MKRVPAARDVDAVLKQAGKAVKNCLTELHQHAAKAMAKGRYDVAEQFIAKGREIQGFQTEMEALRKRWHTLKALATSHEAKLNFTPLWRYYTPILQALEERDGEATRADIEPQVEKLMQSEFTSADTQKMAGGRERWQAMIGRARRHLIKEGWVEEGTGKMWRITPAGRRAAQSSPK